MVCIKLSDVKLRHGLRMPLMACPCDPIVLSVTLQSADDTRLPQTLSQQSLDQRLILLFIHDKMLAPPAAVPDGLSF